MAQLIQVLDEDTRVNSDNPDTNYGDDSEMAVTTDQSGAKAGREDRSLARVDFSAEGIASAEVDTAYLYAYVSLTDNDDDMGIRWDRVSSAWTEMGVTWNNQPTVTTPVSDVQYADTGLWWKWDIKDLIKDAIDSRSSILDILALRVSFNNSIDNFEWVRTHEYVGDATKRPYIEVNYTPVVAGVKGGTVI